MQAPPLPGTVNVSSIFHAHVWSYTSGGTDTLIPLATMCALNCGLTYERYLRLLAGEIGA